MNPFSSSRPDGDADDRFDDRGTFVPEHLPAPGPSLEGHDVLSGEDHVAVHERSREFFEERGVYDVTFGYNLAKLNLDRRHPDAGFRYADDAEDPGVLRAEFTPTTEFCPQADVLAKGAFRAWNGLADRHDYDLVRVRVDPEHHLASTVNAILERREKEFLETGEVEAADAGTEGSTQPL